MPRDLSRLFRPDSIAVVGGGGWCSRVIAQSRKMGYAGAVYPVHPSLDEVAGLPAYRSIADLPHAPDATFVGINRAASIEAVAALAARGAGGAVCFAAGFSEARAEDGTATDYQARLVAAAGDMPILGPNCYGFINALDGALLWPDQQGCARIERGVAIITQSSNIAINLTMQARNLPIAYMVTCGNMAQTSQAEIALALLDDPRVTAIGFHIEGFGDLLAWGEVAALAARRDVPLVALKVGRTAQARAATLSHTASLAGADAGAQALLDRLGIARVDDLPAMLEALKLLHTLGRLPAPRVASISCSGGEAALAADLGAAHGVQFPALTPDQKLRLRAALGARIALSNPLDYNTYIWGDTEAMTQAFCAMSEPDLPLIMVLCDYPRTDARDWACVTQAAMAAHRQSGQPYAVVATLPELMPEDTGRQLAAAGVLAIGGLREAMAAVAAAANARAVATPALLAAGAARRGVLLDEHAAKRALAAAGVPVPRGACVTDREALEEAAKDLHPPLVLKGLGCAHKTEAGLVRLGLDAGTLAAAAQEMSARSYLVEEQVGGGVSEVQVGIVHDPAHGFVMTLAAGGTHSELLADSASILVPASQIEVEQALMSLRIAPVLRGYRGRPGASIPAILDAVEAVQAYVLANADRVEEVEINPLICTPSTAWAVDALLKETPR